MPLKPLITTLSIFLILLTLNPIKSYANITYGVERQRTCSSSGEPEGLTYDAIKGGKDVEFVMSNPVCVTVALTIYASVKVALSRMNSICGNNSPIRITPSPILDSIDIIKCTKKAASGNTECGKAVAAAVTSLGVFFAEMQTVYQIANAAYEDTEICGHEWYHPNPAKYVMTASGYKQVVQDAIKEYTTIENEAERKDKLSLSNSIYREYYYNGMEFKDSVVDDIFESSNDEVCRDPSATGGGLSITSDYKDFPPQRYYLRGLEAGNYNCKKYKILPGQDDPLGTPGEAFSQHRKDLYEKAYNCCKSRSQNYICIRRYNNNAPSYDEHVFCRAGKKCTVRGITYETKAVDEGSLICANSYSVCPYNFSISGGTQYCSFYKDAAWDNDRKTYIPIANSVISSGQCAGKSEIRDNDCTINNKAGRCRNYCQYLTHCTQTSAPDFPYNSGLKSPYFSSACMNFIGDSLNRTSYNTGFIVGSQRHFSAPIAQCVKETLENIFHNRAGHSLCLSKDDIPSSTGQCNGDYSYRKGYKVQQESFFEKIQNTLHSAIKMVLTLSIAFYGFNILIGKADIRQKKDILMFLAKIAFIMYFALGDAWQSTFFNGLYAASTEFSRMVFKISVEDEDIKNDGCQFGMMTKSDGSQISSERIYPPDKNYLALWDTLDCKIARYLGFGPEVSSSNLAALIFAGMFSSIIATVAIYFCVALMFFGFFMIALTIRALHIFLSSIIAIILMVFISPIIIPTILFKKTENIFKSWLTNLISFCLQPMILFAYIAIMIMVFDKSMIGSATFFGPGPMRSISCATYCKNANGSLSPITTENPCEDDEQKIIEPMNDSVACLIGVNSFDKFPGLEVIGISLPIFNTLLNSNAKERILTILKGALIMYLLYKFADQIPEITSTIIGGATLPTASTNAMNMFKKVRSVASGIQKRATRGGEKLAKRYANKVKEGARKAGDKGKETADTQDNHGTNTAGGGSPGNASGGGGGSNASGGGGGSSQTSS